MARRCHALGGHPQHDGVAVTSTDAHSGLDVGTQVYMLAFAGIEATCKNSLQESSCRSMI
jgi:hypothetical protein